MDAAWVMNIVLELKEGVEICNPNTVSLRYSCQAMSPIIFIYVYIVSYVNVL